MNPLQPPMRVSTPEKDPMALPSGSSEWRAINSKTADFLLSAEGRAAARPLTALDLSGAETLAHLDELRRRFSPTEAGALLALARLRQQAADKFPHAEEMFFTGEALEQATAHPVAVHHAEWIDRHAPPGQALDLGCGIGGDTLALAQVRPVIAYETDPVRLRFARANAEALNLAGRIDFRLADWTHELETGQLPPAAAAFADPARRVAGKRVFHLDQIQPPIRWLLRLQEEIPALGVKVMPGVQDDELPAGCGVEFISHAGVCKEAVLWFGPLACHARWASVHVNIDTVDTDTGAAWHTLVSTGERPPTGPLAPGMALHEPDAAVIRAGAFAELCALLDAHLFDAQIAYIVSPAPVSPTLKQSPLVQTFRVEEIHPAGLKLLNRRLQALGIGTVELKKRGVPFEPESLRPRLKLTPGGRAGVVIFTRQGKRRIMIIGRRV